MREKTIIKTSIYGIVVNLILVAFKAAVGLVAGSITIVLDAVNNLTDALSSVVTILGTKLAGRAPDREHPYGHGRIEYMTTLVVGAIVLFAGVSAMIEAAPKIIHPELADYSVVSLIIVAVAVVVKFVFGKYVKGVGQKIHSGSLVASGADAIFDSVLSFSTLVGAIITMVWQISLDGWIGVVIAAFIIKASVEMLHEAWMDIVGRRPDSKLAKQIKTAISDFPEVSGAYDLVLHDYGPNEVIGSVHIQVPDKMDAKEIHRLTRDITYKIYAEFRVILTVGIYADNTDNQENRAIKNALQEIVKKYPEVLQMHGFYVDDEKKLVAFDLIIDFKSKDRNKVKNKVVRKIKEQFPAYKYLVTLDVDMSD